MWLSTGWFVSLFGFVPNASKHNFQIELIPLRLVEQSFADNAKAKGSERLA